MWRRGPLWGDAADDLNVTLLAWPPGEGPAEHVNDERDVVIVVAAGTGLVVLNGVPRHVRSRHVVVVPRGASRAQQAGPDWIRYLPVHRRRGGLEIGRVASGVPRGTRASAYMDGLPRGSTVALTGNSWGSSPSAAS